MEGTTELNESLDNTADTPHIKRKENDQPPQQPESCNVAMEHPAPIISSDAIWPEHLSMETLAGRDVNYNSSSQSVSETMCTSPRLLNDPGVMVEELTLKNYKSPHLSVGGCSSSGEPARKGFWQNFRSIAVGSRDDAYKESAPMDDRPDASSAFLPQLWLQRSRPSLQIDQYYSKVSDHMAESENRVASANANFPGGIQTKVLPASGFAQFLLTNTLKGKGVACKYGGLPDAPGNVVKDQNNERYNRNMDIVQNSSQKPSIRTNGGLLLGGAGFGVSGSQSDGTTLREWLKPRRQKLNKAERLHIFKQILEFVDISHSQGHALQHLRPSYFVVSSSNQVKYVGSFSPKCQMELLSDPKSQNHYLENPSKRKRYSEQDKEKNEVLSKHLKHGGHSFTSILRHSPRGISKGAHVQESDAATLRLGKSGRDIREQLKFGESYKPRTTPFIPALSPAGFQQSNPDIVKVEERWYASPEELADEILCPFASNIYCLGVLLFELFCNFESWEAHSSAMLNLRQRILPPSFLSESPKEAGYCLWLLHPEPSSRPKSRDILLCDLISEGRDLPSFDNSSGSMDEEDAEAELLLHFLLILKEQKEKQAEKLIAELGFLNTDIEEVEERHSARVMPMCNTGDPQRKVTDILDVHCPEGSNVEALSRLPVPSKNQERLMRNISQLEHAYFSIRANIELPDNSGTARSDRDVLKIRDRLSQLQNDGDVCNPGGESSDCLGAFFDGMCKYARYNTFEVCGSLRNVDNLSSANVICSLSFDRDEDYFAAAGVSKKIKIFEFGALLNDSVDIHYPVIEMLSRSKLSCVSWNSYIKNYLASTDYEGVVQLWDASTGQGFTQYVEHQKRAWSVDFSQVDPTKLASGSDDCSVKLWSINEKNCIDTIRNVANVCCIQFSSHSSHLLAFGSADYKVYCYDLRNTRIPWCTLSGHGKAVSYVKFVDPEILISASTDNTLKLWDLNKTSATELSSNACSLTFSGHTNEKNFVGLSVSNGYIACGSETNEVYAYYKTLPMPMTSHKFGSIDPITGQETGEDNGQFVSSVCWRGKSNMVVAANSSGSIKLLQMV